MCFSLEVEHTTSQPPKRSGRNPIKCRKTNPLPQKTRIIAKKQVVQEMRKPPRRRLGAGDQAHPEENMEDGLSDSDLPRTRWTHEEGEDKDCYVGF